MPFCLYNNMIPKNPTLPWTQRPGDPPHGRARLCVAVPVFWLAGLHEHGTQVLRQLLVAAEGQGFVQAVSDWASCSGTPSAACIHPPVPKKGTQPQQG